MPRWEHRCFVRLVNEHDGAVAAALRAAGLSPDAPPQERTDVYFPADADHGVKQRSGGAEGSVEVKRVLSRTPVGTGALQLHRIASRGDGRGLTSTPESRRSRRWRQRCGRRCGARR